MSRGARPVIVVFAKAPRAGQVKTRMTPDLTPERAAAFYACMLEDVLRETARAASRFGLDPWLAVHPAHAAPDLAGRVPTAFRVIAQCGSDLSRRMGWTARQCAASGAPFFLLRGSDSPALTQDRVGEAIDAMRGFDLAASPDPDGGYNLLALQRPIAGLFDHAMSTNHVLLDTFRNAELQGARVKALGPSFDLDVARDCARLATLDTPTEREACASTLSFASEAGLLDETF